MMGVVKLTASKKAVQFITDEGWVYQTSVLFLQSLLNGGQKTGILKMVKLPNPISTERFEKSEIWNAPKITFDNQNEDPLSVKARNGEANNKVVEDSKDW